MSSRKYTAHLLATIPIALIGLFVVAPVINIFRASLRLDSLTILRTTSIRNVVWFTTWQALVSTLAVLLIAMPIAFCMANFKFPSQQITATMISMPFVLPSIVVGVAFLEILPRDSHRTAFALILAHIYFNFGFALRLISVRWLQIHPHLDDAARTLGASPKKIFSTITMPLLAKAIINASTIVFTLCFTSYGVVRVLGGPSRSTLETEIYFRAMQLGDVSGAMILSALQVMVVAALVYVGSKLNRNLYERTALPAISRQKPLRTTTHKVALTIIVGSATAFAVAPVIAIAFRSVFSNSRFTVTAWREVFSSIEIIRALTKTVLYAALAMTLATLLGLLGACAIAYGPKKLKIISSLTALPIVVSAVSIGLGIIVTFDSPPFDWRGSQLMLPVAHALIALPLTLRIISPVLQTIPDSLRQASSVLGASSWQTWWNIDLKIIRRAVISATAIAAAVSIGEFGASSFLSRRGTETLPLTISRLLSRPGDTTQTQAFVLATLLVLFSIAIIFMIDSLANISPRRDSDA